jgi:large repetitive protein
VGNCGGGSEATCWCDDACQTYGDCCFDNFQVCKTPAISGINPVSGPTDGGIVITILGGNFASNDCGTTDCPYPNCFPTCPEDFSTQPQVGKPYLAFQRYGPGTAFLKMSALTWTSTQITFTLPSGQGVEALPFIFNMYGLAVSYPLPNGISFGYTSPVVTSVSPSTGFTQGGSLITLTGTNFGNGSDINIVTSVTLDGRNCLLQSSPAFFSSKIIFFLPKHQGQGLDIVVTVGGQSSAPAQFSYSPPQITAVTPTVGVIGQNLTLTGVSFGQVNGQVSVGNIDCPVLLQTDTQVVCSIPPGQGTINSVRYVLDVTVFSQGSSFNFAYTAPTISSMVPVSGSTQGGTAILLLGTNFGSSQATGSVIFNGVAATILSWNYTTITLLSVAGEGTNVQVNVIAGSQTSSQLFYSYNGPVVNSVSPNRGPTSGGIVITVTGTNFGGVSTPPSVTIGGSICSLINYTAHFSVLCSLPAGTGLSKSVMVTAYSQISPANSLFSYDPPSLTELNAQGAHSTQGGNVVSIVGTNFGTTGTASIGGTVCVPVSSGWSSSLIVCIAPAGQGLNLSVVVTVASQSSSQFLGYSYDAPVVSSFSPASGPTQGGVALTILGSNLGTVASVKIGGVTCTSPAASHTQIICSVGIGSGTNNSILVSVGGQFPSGSPIYFSYNAPTVVSANPLVSDSGGGVLITIVGSSFDTSGSIKIGDSLCPLVGLWSHTYLVCSVPPGQGAASNLTVYNALGQASNPLTFAYAAPVITSVTPVRGVPAGGTQLLIIGTSLGVSPVVYVSSATCTLVNITSSFLVCSMPVGAGLALPLYVSAGGQASNTLLVSYVDPFLSSLFPLSGPSQGGNNLTLQGSYFGSDSVPITILVGGQACAPIYFHTDSQVVCAAPAGVGNQVTVKLVVSASGTQTSNSLSYSYGGPLISSVSPSTGFPTEGGATVVLYGVNFGNSITPLVSVSGVSCTVLQFDDASITFILPPGSGLANTVQVDVSGQTASAAVINYAAPVVTSVTFAPGADSTAGGGLITVTGQNFGTAGVVSVAGSQCSRSSYIPDTAIVCMLLPGQGMNLVVAVTLAAQSSGANSGIFSYAAPTIASLVPSSGPTSGLDLGSGLPSILTITGDNFGIGGFVTLGATATCTLVSWSHTQIRCNLPQGQGLNVPVLATVGGQISSASPAFFSYTAPTLVSISPPSGPTQGGLKLTISGTNLGISALVNISSQICTVSFQSHSQVVCNQPAGEGSAIPIFLSVGGQLAVSLSLLFSYDAPSLSSLFPTHGPTAGSSFQVSGSSFGATAGQVFVGNRSCVVSAWTHTSITCTAPVFEGASLPVTVLTSILASSNSLAYSYDPPFLSSISPSTLPTVGGEITIIGINFGASTSVAIGSNSCAVISWSQSTVVCTAPPGQGIGLYLVVTVAGQVSNTLLFSYSDPFITGLSPASGRCAGGEVIVVTGTSFGISGPVLVSVAGSLCLVLTRNHTTITCVTPVGEGANLDVRVALATQNSNVAFFSYLPPFVASISPTHGPTLGGGELTIYGDNFGQILSAPSVTMNSVACPVLKFNYTTVTCTIPAGQGVNAQVTVILNGQSSSQMAYFDYDGPMIMSLTPTSSDTNGGVQLTVSGLNFGTSGFVLIGGITCPTTIAPTVVGSYEKVECLVPAGQGANLSVTVTVLAQTSAWPAASGISGFSYNPPTLLSITPSTGGTAGGSLVTLSGTSFGLSGQVTIGGSTKLCSNVVGQYLQTSLVCAIPSGAGRQLVSMCIKLTQIIKVSNVALFKMILS